MRLISQDETVDLPYEHTTLTVSDGYIWASSPEFTGSVARYSSEKRAIGELGHARTEYEFGRASYKFGKEFAK